MLLFYFILSSEDELPAPTTHEEKVKTEMSQSCRANGHIADRPLSSGDKGPVAGCQLCSPAAVSLTAEAAGDRESREVAEDGEEVG